MDGDYPRVACNRWLITVFYPDPLLHSTPTIVHLTSKFADDYQQFINHQPDVTEYRPVVDGIMILFFFIYFFFNSIIATPSAYGGRYAGCIMILCSQ